MLKEEKIKMFKDVFAPKYGEKVLFLVDKPHDNIIDNQAWNGRREMAVEWYESFKEMGDEIGFTVDFVKFNATGLHNTPLPDNIIDIIRKSNLVLAMTEFSASSSLLPIGKLEGNITRGASMPLVEKRMEETALRADYSQVQKYAGVLYKLLDNAVGADVLFSTGDHLYIDLRNRNPFLEAGDCTKTGQFINFPSGEACKAPYEAAPDEIEEFGESKTEGIMPVRYDDELVKFKIKNNKIVEIIGDGIKADQMRKFFEKEKSHRNIAELGLGCNPNAVVTGNALEDEKVGLHIAYGMSTHLGGKVKSDMHIDIIYAKDCPVEGTTLTLLNIDGTKTQLIKNSQLQYNLLK